MSASATAAADPPQQEQEDIPAVVAMYEPRVNYGTMEAAASPDSAVANPYYPSAAANPYYPSANDVPTYTETDEDGLEARIERAKANELAPITLPLTEALTYPWGYFNGSIPDASEEEKAAVLERFKLSMAIVDAFFAAVRHKRDEQVESMVREGLVSPDVKSLMDDRPLLAAVRAGNPAMILTLGRLGADVSLMGHQSNGEAMRTPLQLAAQEGNLAAVRVLMEDLHADDAFVAPDGEIALRLAAKGGHREVVDYLPSRRDGGWQRWKTAHAREARVIHEAAEAIRVFCKFFFWSVPKFIVYTTPRWLWEERKAFGRWCKKQIVELPRRAKKAAKGLVRGIKEIPGLVKKIPAAVKKAAKAVAKASKAVADWVVKGVTKIAKAIGWAFNRAMSFLHTVVMAVVEFFKTITLKDVWNGLVAVVRSLFVEVPKAIWRFIIQVRDVSWKVLVALFGGLGAFIWFTAYGIFWLVRYIPTKIWEILAACGRLVGKAFHELAVWINPKMV